MLTEAARLAEYYGLLKLQRDDPQHPELARRIERFNAKTYQSWTPKRVNDFVAYYQSESESESEQPTHLLAVVLIACPPNIAIKFWHKRIEQYERVAQVIKVFGVFKDEAQANTHKELIKAAGLRVTIYERLAKMLENTREKELGVASALTRG